jgi:predicted GIY-YIG superfamily endonuclease
LLYFEACFNKEDAIAREKQLKTGFGRAYLKRRLSELRK